MPLFSRIVFSYVNLRARKGLAPDAEVSFAKNPAFRNNSTENAIVPAKTAAQRTGMRGETFAYWYLRRHGYVIISRNFMVPGVKGEIDLAGYDGKVLSFIEVK